MHRPHPSHLLQSLIALAQSLSLKLVPVCVCTHIPCRAVPIGRIEYPVEHIIENVMKGMMGVISKIPRGWRNIQAVHLKTVDSIALPVYNSLPPEPQLLAPVEEGPKKKRVQLDDVPTGTSSGNQD